MSTTTKPRRMRVGDSVTLLVDYDLHLQKGRSYKIVNFFFDDSAVAIEHPNRLTQVWFSRRDVELGGDESAPTEKEIQPSRRNSYPGQ